MIRTKRTTRKKTTRPRKMAISLTMMMTKKKTRSNKRAWHPPALVLPSKLVRSTRMRRPQWITILCTTALVAWAAASYARAQEGAPLLPDSTSTPKTAAATPSKTDKKKYSHVNDFLIRGTVFTDKALSFPGVQLRIRRAGEKRFRWESYTNSRGEFAVRVPRGSDYEMVIHARGFAEQTRAVDAKAGENGESMVFRMQPTSGGKG